MQVEVHDVSQLELHKFCDLRMYFPVLNVPLLMGQSDKCKVEGCTDENILQKGYCENRKRSPRPSVYIEKLISLKTAVLNLVVSSKERETIDVSHVGHNLQLHTRRIRVDPVLDHDEKIAKDTKKYVSAEYEAERAKVQADEERRQREQEKTTPPRKHATTASSRTGQQGGDYQRWRDTGGYGEPSSNRPFKNTGYHVFLNGRLMAGK